MSERPAIPAPQSPGVSTQNLKDCLNTLPYGTRSTRKWATNDIACGSR
jgi:hypothetical protein